MILYLAFTHLERIDNMQKAIFWYCPERITPAASYEQILEDFHLYPDEPVMLNGFEKNIYYDTFTEEERDLLLTDIDEASPFYIKGVDFKKEEIEFFLNFRYSKDEARRAVNEFFTKNELGLLRNYLKLKFGYKLEVEVIKCPIDHVSFFGYCREPWDCEKEPDFILDQDPDFPLDIPVEGSILNAYLIQVCIEDGNIHFFD
jgi:hypothetical protein